MRLKCIGHAVSLFTMVYKSILTSSFPGDCPALVACSSLFENLLRPRIKTSHLQGLIQLLSCGNVHM